MSETTSERCSRLLAAFFPVPGFRCASPGLQNKYRTTKKQRRWNAEKRNVTVSAPRGRMSPHVPRCRARRCPRPTLPAHGGAGRGQLASRRSTHGSRWVVVTSQLSFRPGFLGLGGSARSAMLAPTGGRRPSAVTRALSAPACPSPGKAPPAPAVVPERMMPEAARERVTSPRAGAALAPPPGLSPRGVLRERDSSQCVAEAGTIVKGFCLTQSDACGAVCEPVGCVEPLQNPSLSLAVG